MPAYCNRLWRRCEEALSVPRGDLELVLCGACGLVYNAAFDPSLVTYSKDYENAQHFSAHFSRFLDGLAELLVATYGLHDKEIVEIGCGDASFLRRLCAGGRNRGLGLDPAVPFEGVFPGESHITLARALGGEGRAPGKADFLCCRHLLEHLQDPRHWLEQVKAYVGEGGLVYCEVPDGRFTWERLGIWDLLYEHGSYFCDVSLTRLFARAGLEVIAVRSLFEGQFLGLEARLGAPGRKPLATGGQPSEAAGSASALDRLQRDLAAFRESYHAKVAAWEERLAGFHAAGRRVVVWGGGTKGVMFVNTVAGGASIAAVVDVNPRKQGCYVSGTGHEIVAPAALRHLQPEVVLVMNPAYESEIRTELEELRLSPEVCVV
ncbi:MAG: class I SAM-dependent methyltransferase [Planctomycetota bacterium]